MNERCTRVSTLCCMIPSVVSTTSPAPTSIRRSCTSPAVSSGPMRTSWRRMMPPVSMSLSIMKVVTPVMRSPLITAQFMGAAPRYCGSRAACRLKVPSLGMPQTSSGSMRNATTTKRSAFHAASCERNSGSLSLSGCSTGRPCSTAYFLTADSCTSSPRPLGLSATVTTPTTLYPAFTRASSDATANSGVPMNTILAGRKKRSTLLLILRQ